MEEDQKKNTRVVQMLEIFDTKQADYWCMGSLKEEEGDRKSKRLVKAVEKPHVEMVDAW